MQRQDLEAAWNMDAKSLNKIKDCKLALEIAALQSHPRFVSYKEDEFFKDKEKWGKYFKKRPVMWDMTNMRSFHFTGSQWQRIMWSNYYGADCCKGGVGLQQCGWIVTEDLWVGGVSDSDYNKNLDI